MRDSHPQDSEFVRFPSEGTTSGYHIWQLCDVGRHLVSSPPFNLAMILPTVNERKKAQYYYKFEENNKIFSVLLISCQTYYTLQYTLTILGAAWTENWRINANCIWKTNTYNLTEFVSRKITEIDVSIFNLR